MKKETELVEYGRIAQELKSVAGEITSYLARRGRAQEDVVGEVGVNEAGGDSGVGGATKDEGNNIHLKCFISRVVRDGELPKDSEGMSRRSLPFIKFSITVLRQNLKQLAQGSNEGVLESVQMFVLSSFASLHLFDRKELKKLKEIGLICPYQLLDWCTLHRIEFTEEENCPDREYYLSYLAENRSRKVPDPDHVLGCIATRLSHCQNDSKTPIEIRNLISGLQDHSKCLIMLKKMEEICGDISFTLGKYFVEKAQEVAKQFEEIVSGVGIADTANIDMEGVLADLRNFMEYIYGLPIPRVLIDGGNRVKTFSGKLRELGAVIKSDQKRLQGMALRRASSLGANGPEVRKGSVSLARLLTSAQVCHDPASNNSSAEP
jgi:hypothetical protein